MYLGSATDDAQVAPANDDIIRFVNRVLPAAAADRFYGLHWFDNDPKSWDFAKSKNMSRPPLRGRAFTDSQAMASWARTLMWHASKGNYPQPDLYACMALCGMAVMKTSKQGNTYFDATRRVNTFRASRALYADFDVKPDSYPDKAAIHADIDAHVAAGRLPPPTLRVDSGNGIHVHWVLDRELTLNEWESLGKPFSDYLIKTLGMKIDPGITSDPVRILRLPGTINAKDRNNPLPTAFVGPIDPNDIPVSTFEALLGAAVVQRAAAVSNVVNFPGTNQKPAITADTLPAAFQNHTPFVPVPAAPEIGSGIDPDEYGGQPLDFDKVVAECPTLSDIRARNGAGDPGVLWMMAILAASFAPEGERSKWAHEFSSGYATYSYDETEAKLQEKVNARLATGGRIGWPTCATIAKASTKCQGCPLNGQGKSPLHAGQVVRPVALPGALPIAHDLPTNYYRVNGTIVRDTKDEEGPDQRLVITHDILDANLEERPDGVFLSAQVVHPKNPPTRLRLPISAASSWRDDAMKSLAAAQIVLLPEQIPEARKFMVAFIQQLQARQPNVLVRDSFGWVKTRSGAQGFAFDGRVFGPGGSEEAATTGDEYFRQKFHATGSLSEWKQASDLLLGMGRIDIAAAFATAFAAPLMPLTGQNGAIVSVYSPISGVQKSSALILAQSVWGNPKTAMSRLDDTANAVGKKLGALRNLPVYWDELQTREAANGFARLAFGLTQGTEKSRMQADTKLRATGEWATLLVCGSNNSVREIMLAESAAGSGAGVARVLEFEVKKAALTSSAAAAAVTLNKTQENFGVIGVEYAKLLVDKQPHLAAALTRIAQSFETALNGDTEHRFWIAAASTIMLGAALANTLHGGALVQFPLADLKKFLTDTLLAQKTARDADVTDIGTEDMAVSVVQGFINHCRAENACLETDTVPHGAGRPAPVALRFYSDDARRLLKVPKAHVIHDDGKVRFKMDDFRRYVREIRKLPFDAVERDLKQYGAMTRQRTRWAAGTQWSGAVEYYYEIDTHSQRTPLGARIGHGK